MHRLRLWDVGDEIGISTLDPRGGSAGEAATAGEEPERRWHRHNDLAVGGPWLTVNLCDLRATEALSEAAMVVA